MTALVLQYIKDTITSMQLPIQVVDGDTIPEFPEFNNNNGINWVHGLARVLHPTQKHYPKWVKPANYVNLGMTHRENTWLPCEMQFAIGYKPPDGSGSYTRYKDSYYMLELPLYWGNNVE